MENQDKKVEKVKNEVTEEAVNDEKKEEATESFEPLKERPVEQETVKEDISKQNSTVPFLNKRVDKEKMRYFLAGMATTLAIGFIGCVAFGFCKSSNPSLPATNYYSHNQQQHFDELREYYNRIDKQIEEFNRRIADVEQFRDEINRFEGEKRNKSSVRSHEENEYNQGFVFRNEQIVTPYYSIIVHDEKVKIKVLNPERVVIQREPDGRMISSHYYIEDITDGKTVIRVDKTVDVETVGRGYSANHH